jgi:hypothetical protein
LSYVATAGPRVNNTFPHEHPTEWLANLINRNHITAHPVMAATDCVHDHVVQFTPTEVVALFDCAV